MKCIHPPHFIEIVGPRTICEDTPYRTVSGRQMTPAPKYDVSSPRKAVNSIRRHQMWLYENAQDEAGSRSLLFLASKPGRRDMTTADIDECTTILWGRLIYDGRLIGLPESVTWCTRHATPIPWINPSEIDAYPRWYSREQKLTMVLDLMMDGR